MATMNAVKDAPNESDRLSQTIAGIVHSRPIGHGLYSTQPAGPSTQPARVRPEYTVGYIGALLRDCDAVLNGPRTQGSHG